VAKKYKIPVMSADPSSAESTPVLAAWGFDYYKMGKATGRLVVRILKGEKPRISPPFT
jgi:putative ABC transport system substrate-binding protein